MGRRLLRDGRPVTALATSPLLDAADRVALHDHYGRVRRHTDDLAAPLSEEDQVVQSMADVSPTKWHRAHTTWFFETFLLTPRVERYAQFDPAFAYLFNSYYEAVGPRHPRPQRGLLSRPSVAEVARYRAHVDDAMHEFIDACTTDDAELIVLGLNHEQQHQELLLMDIKHVLSRNPLRPVYAGSPSATTEPDRLGWVDLEGGLVEIGHRGAGFSFDNELPRHQQFLEPYRLADRLVTNGEWLEFMADGGYHRHDLWLSDGWGRVREEGWEAPFYWTEVDGQWFEHSLNGTWPVNPGLPVGHVSFYEAAAYAAWAGKPLPSEAAWEHAAATMLDGLSGSAEPDSLGNLADADTFHPRAAGAATGGLRQMFGDCWEWTTSAYHPYPGFHPAEGAIGEYNGKFMSNQMVLRGGCAFTPAGHARVSYRNFFPHGARWALSGVRLAEGRRAA
jgi:ergothioneine biosynthesis protein EgtB